MWHPLNDLKRSNMSENVTLKFPLDESIVKWDKEHSTQLWGTDNCLWAVIAETCVSSILPEAQASWGDAGGRAWREGDKQGKFLRAHYFPLQRPNLECPATFQWPEEGNAIFCHLPEGPGWEKVWETQSIVSAIGSLQGSVASPPSPTPFKGPSVFLHTVYLVTFWKIHSCLPTGQKLFVHFFPLQCLAQGSEVHSWKWPEGDLDAQTCEASAVLAHY